MKTIYIIQLKERYKPGDRITYYQYEMNDILYDTKELRESTIFDNDYFANELAEHISKNFDYETKVLQYNLVS